VRGGKVRPPFGPPVVGAPGLLDQNQQAYPPQIAKAMGVQNTVPAKLDPLISVGIQLEDYTAPEFWWLRRAPLVIGGAAAGPVALEKPWVQLEAAAGTLLVVEQIIIANTSGTAHSVEIGLALGGGGGTVATAQLRDTRYFPGQPIATTRAGTSLAPIVPTGLVVAFANDTTTIVPVAFVLGSVVGGPPPLALKVVGRAVNTAMSVAFVVRERSLLESEK